jgi:H/ACA ribonucleoprotein complex subunit 4
MMNLKKIKQEKSLKELLEFGILNIDKPAGCTSFDVVQRVKEILKCKKTSHFGTLDPMVTGVLPVALNRGVKLTGFFISHDKEYIGVMRLHQDVDLQKVKEAIEKKFIGIITQLPPKKSRVKRQERQREIKIFELIEKKGKDISFKTEVQGGTYIRKLIHDLGEELGIGANMIKLRRIRAGIFEEKDSITLEKLEEISADEKKLKEIVIPGEIVSELYANLEVKENNLKQLLTGKPIHKSDLAEKAEFEKEEIICVHTQNQLIGMYKVVNEGEIVAMPEFVKN